MLVLSLKESFRLKRQICDSIFYLTEFYTCAWETSYIWNNSQLSLSFSSIQLYKPVIIQYWNPSARALCYSLNAGPQSQCFGSAIHGWTMCSHIEHVPSIPVHWTGCISKESRIVQRFTTTQSCTFTRTHTRTHRHNTQLAGAGRHLTVRAGPQQRNRLGTEMWVWRRSVVLKQRQQVVAAVVGQVGGTQVGQQLVWIGQLREKLDGTEKQKTESQLSDGNS